MIAYRLLAFLKTNKGSVDELQKDTCNCILILGDTNIFL